MSPSVTHRNSSKDIDRATVMMDGGGANDAELAKLLALDTPQGEKIDGVFQVVEQVAEDSQISSVAIDVG